MTAAVHILCGPAATGKSRRLGAECVSACRHGPGTVLWLAPSLRRAEELRGLLPATSLWLGTFQELADQLVAACEPESRPLSRVQRRLVLEAIVSELHERGQLSHFARVADTRGFADGVAAVLEELARHDVSPDEFLRAAALRPGTAGPVEEAHGGQPMHAKDRQLARLHTRYRQHLHVHGLLDPDGRLARARDLLGQGRRGPFDRVRTVFLDDFADLTTPQVELVTLLASFCEHVWLSLPLEPGERAELFAPSCSTLARLEPLEPQVEWLEATREREPAGLVHLERSLFRPLRSIAPAADAEGLSLIEAPGALGEARLVAREIKRLLLDGVAADDVLVSARELGPYADLLAEVLAEYGIPADVEGTDPLTRDPAVALLLRAVRLPDDDWPFAAVTALLRSTCFRPHWPEAAFDPAMPERAEVLLRLLGEPRGRDAYLAAVRSWAEREHPGLEDEQAEASRRRRTHELAGQCRPLLERFFQTWDDMPQTATLDEHVAWLREFAADLGLSGAGAAGWRRLWEEIDRWRELDRLAGAPRLDRKAFHRRLQALAAEAGLARTRRGPGRVRVLSAPLACDLDADHVFVLGLGERSFPRLTPPAPLFDEAERQAFCEAGLALPTVADLMAAETLLFYRLATRARRRLVLCYPAVDDRGQALLPSAFLHAVLDAFVPGAVPVLRRTMLIEGVERDEPLSPAEERVRAAARGTPAGLAPELAANLADAAAAAHSRFRDRAFGPHDGRFRDPAVVAELQQLFGPQKVFSPTALEDYVTCPFRFFLGQVLRLEPLEAPREEIELTRRGQAFHRALSRLHQRLRADGVHQPDDRVDADVREQTAQAIAEDVTRAAGPASKVLWQLEGERMLRVASRYRRQWQDFVKPWDAEGVVPEPYLFEADFGLPAAEGAPALGPLVIRGQGTEVRISGRIDRVDRATLEDGGVGFWIIDYKTGRSANYTGTALATFRKLQLTLYALAAEEVLLAGERARPLGLAYWLLADGGPKVVLPAGKGAVWLRETERWRVVRQTLEEWVLTLAGHIREGLYPLNPRDDHCTQTCPYGQVCRITQSRSVEKDWSLELPVLP